MRASREQMSFSDAWHVKSSGCRPLSEERQKERKKGKTPQKQIFGAFPAKLCALVAPQIRNKKGRKGN